MHYTKILKYTVLGCATLVCAAITLPVQAQDDTVLPKLPDPIQNLADGGAQVRFLGKEHGLEGWVVIKNGQEQYFYVLPNNNGFLSGLLFDNTGKAVTIDQVSRLRKQSGTSLLDSLANDPSTEAAVSKDNETKYEFKSPSEQLYADIEDSNWIPVGFAGTPMLYSFVDPQCPHCHDMMLDMKPLIDAEKVQVRIIPIGFKDETRAQAAYLLAAPSPDKLWWRHLEGDTTALPARQEINQQGVQRNMSIMQSWKLDVTPLIIYRGKDGKVKIIRGKPKDINTLIKDLGART